MTSSVKRPNFLNSILQVLLVVSILGFVLSTTWMFITSDACGVYAYGSIALFCLINSVGITLIRRWHKMGVWMCLLACLVECNSLLIWRFPMSAGATSSFPNNYLLLVTLCIFLVVATPLFVLKAKPSNKTIWSEMMNGMDIKHSRHIYQLTSVLLVGVIITMLFYKPSITAIDESLAHFNDTDDKGVVQRIVNYTLLDSVNVTLNEIVSIESLIDSIPIESRSVYNKRIFALKHVLLSGFMTDKHNTLKLKNIFKIHTGDFSKEQQRILDWYLNLPQEDQEVWLACPPVDNVSDFEKEVKQRIATKST